MAEAPYQVAHMSAIPTRLEPEPGGYEWKPVRHYFGIQSFGINVEIGREPGDWVVEDHTELRDSGTRHEELFFVSHGHARFTVGGEEIDAPAGTFVFVPDPATMRGARALEAGTTVLAMGGEPGAPFTVSPWEAKYWT